MDVWKSLRRIDYVRARSSSRLPKGEIRRIGVEPSERIEGVAGKLRPSDHAGLRPAVR